MATLFVIWLARGDEVLLRPPLLFEVSIVNSEGDVLVSSRPSAQADVAARDVFQSQRQADVISVGRSRRDPASGTWRLDCSRRLEAPDGDFAGIVMLSVDAAYFVSVKDTA